MHGIDAMLWVSAGLAVAGIVLALLFLPWRATAAATASPALTHSIASIPCTKAERTWSSSAGDPAWRATAMPANTLLRTALAVAAGSPARCSWAW